MRQTHAKRLQSVSEEAWNLHEYGIDVPNREIYLVGEPDRMEGGIEDEPGVEFAMANRLIKNLRVLAQADPKTPILIHMKTCGGIVEEGLAIYDAIRLCPATVVILNYTHARSMSSIILQAADWRVMMPYSYFMFHRGEAEFSGEYLKVVANVDFYKRFEAIMLEIYVARMKEKGKHKPWSPGRIRQMLSDRMNEKTDVFLMAAEAISWGLADEVFDGDWKRLKEFSE